MGPVLSSDRCSLRLSKNFHLNSNDHGSLSRTNIFFSFKKSDCLEGPKLCAGFFKNLESRPILANLLPDKPMIISFQSGREKLGLSICFVSLTERILTVGNGRTIIQACRQSLALLKYMSMSTSPSLNSLFWCDFLVLS